MQKLTVQGDIKQFRSDDYNYNFNMKTGFFQRWGKNVMDDPTSAPTAEIADIEVSINGCPKGKDSGKLCSFCYKNNSSAAPTYMLLDAFKEILNKFPKYDGHFFLNQIALGITSVHANPNLIQIMEYIRECGIVPNVTISGRDILSDEEITKLVRLVGATAFSVYQEDKDQCYELINRFIKAGLKQCNIHYMICEETINFAYTVLDDIMHDPRLLGLTAIVFLGLKPKLRGVGFHVLSMDKYEKLISFCLTNRIPFGADSCSCGRVQKSIMDCANLSLPCKEYIISMTDKCESCLESFYINCHGMAFPCSFAEDIEVGLDMLSVSNFNTQAWNSPAVVDWRKRLLALDRECPLYPEIRAPKS